MGFKNLKNDNESQLDLVCPDVADRWRQVEKLMWENHNYKIRITEGYRSFESQLAVWKQGRKKTASGWVVVDPKKIVTHAMPGESFHQYGLAIDSCFEGGDPYLDRLPKNDCTFLWNEYGRFCKSVGLEWGGDWKGSANDRPHCQMTYGYTIHTLQIAFEKIGIQGVWDKCKTALMCGGELV